MLSRVRRKPHLEAHDNFEDWSVELGPVLHRLGSAEFRAKFERASKTLSRAGLAISLLAIAINLAVSYGKRVLPPFELLLQREWLRLICIVAILACGGLLFLFRLKMRWYYGLLEISSAAVFGWRALGSMTEDGPSDATALLAVAYLVVRGLDNCYQARQERSKVN